MTPTTDIPFIQLNMHRAFVASVQLTKTVISNPSICLLTEPTTAYNKVTNVPMNHICIPSSPLPTRPRTALLLPRNMPHVFLADAAVALVHTKCGKILIASIYLDLFQQNGYTRLAS